VPTIIDGTARRLSVFSEALDELVTKFIDHIVRLQVCCSWASPPGELRLYWILVAWREVCYLDVVAPEIHVLACSSEVSFASPLGEAPFILLIVKLS